MPILRNYRDAGGELLGVKYNDAGYMYGVIKCARTGFQEYHTSELGLMGDEMIQVHRSSSEVFSKDSRKTFVHVPITIGHPQDGVNSENWDEFAVGETSTDVKFEGEWVHVPFMIKSADAIAKIKAGANKASMGYKCEVAFIDGRYEQKNIEINHLAFVEFPRAGDQAGIVSDALKWGTRPVKTEDHMTDLITVVVGDSAVQMSAVDATKFKEYRASLTADHATAIDVKDAAIGELKGKLADAEAKVLSDTDIEARVTARSQLVADAKKVDPDLDPDGKSEAEIKKAAVAKKFGKDSVVDASDAEISGMFKAAMASPSVNDKVRKALGDGVINTNDAWGKFFKGESK